MRYYDWCYQITLIVTLWGVPYVCYYCKNSFGEIGSRNTRSNRALGRNKPPYGTLGDA